MPNGMNDILVVDDNRVLLSLLSEIITESGYSARTASDGFEALAVIRDRVPRYPYLRPEHAGHVRV